MNINNIYSLIYSENNNSKLDELLIFLSQIEILIYNYPKQY